MAARYYESIWLKNEKSIHTSKIEISSQGNPKQSYDFSKWNIHGLNGIITDNGINNIWVKATIFPLDSNFFHCLRAGGQDVEQNTKFPESLIKEFNTEYPVKKWEKIAVKASSEVLKTSHLDILDRKAHV